MESDTDTNKKPVMQSRRRLRASSVKTPAVSLRKPASTQIDSAQSERSTNKPKTVGNRSLRSKPSKKLESASTRTIAASVKIISGSPSLRLREKAVIYQNWYQNHSSRHMNAVANVFGYLFIIGGLLTAFIVSANWVQIDRSLLATLSCGLQDSISTSTECASPNNPETATTSVQKVVVEFFPMSAIDSNRDTELKVRILNYSKIYTHLVSMSTNNRTPLTPLHISSEGVHTYLLPTGSLPAGEYRVALKVANLAPSANLSVHVSPTFTINRDNVANNTNQTHYPGTVAATPTATPPPTTVNATNPPISQSPEETVSDPQTTPNREPTLGTNSSTAENGTDPEVRENPEETEEVPKITPVTDPINAITSPTVTDRSFPTTTLEGSQQLHLSLLEGELPGQYKLLISSSNVVSTIEVYARAKNSTVNLFLGTATRHRDAWFYWLDTQSLPAGNYRIIVEAKKAGELLARVGTELTIKTPNREFQKTPKYETERSKVLSEYQQKTDNSPTPVTSSTLALPTLLPPLEDSQLSDKERKAVENILQERDEEFNQILTRYASARQSGDKTATRLAESALNTEIYTALSEEVLSTEFEPAVYMIEKSIREQIDSVKTKIEQVQTLRREHTNGASSIDQDGDGISDHDEYIIYGTDPANPDTDGDGVTDGIEVMSGYDAMSATPEAVIQFSEPQAIEYVDDSVLSIKETAPLLVYQDEGTNPLVHSEISGVGLPNSFVTLYIYSAPVVVVVKTSDDGSFSYTFTKELEDGEHSVYAALTDNKGEIIVRSSAFSFVKTAEAYSYVGDTQIATPVATAEPTITSAPFHMASAMGVVSFGFILLLLGYSIRQPRRDGEEVKPV